MCGNEITHTIRKSCTHAYAQTYRQAGVAERGHVV